MPPDTFQSVAVNTLCSVCWTVIMSKRSGSRDCMFSHMACTGTGNQKIVLGCAGGKGNLWRSRLLHMARLAAQVMCIVLQQHTTEAIAASQAAERFTCGFWHLGSDCRALDPFLDDG